VKVINPWLPLNMAGYNPGFNIKAPKLMVFQNSSAYGKLLIAINSVLLEH